MAADIDVKVEYAKLEKAMDRMGAELAMDSNEIMKEGIRLAAVSASKATPPAENRNIPVRMYKREIIKLSDRYGRKRYKVPFRTNKKRGSKYFSKQKDARSFQRISLRGIGRAGWFMGLLSRGLKIPAWATAILSRSPDIKGKSISRLTIKKASLTANGKATIENTVDNISRYAHFSEGIGYRKAANRINGMLRKLKNKEFK